MAKAKNANRSSEKTRALIKASFAELLEEKGTLDRIHVTELVGRADINRGTFYLHYTSVDELAKEISSEIAEVFLAGLESRDPGDFTAYFDEIIEHVRANEERYRMLLSSDDPLLFLERLRTRVNGRMAEALTRGRPERRRRELELDIQCFTDGLLTAFLRYFRKEGPRDLDEIRGHIHRWFGGMARR